MLKVRIRLNQIILMTDYFNKLKEYFDNSKNNINSNTGPKKVTEKIIKNISNNVSNNVSHYKDKLTEIDYKSYEDKISQKYIDLSAKVDNDLQRIKITTSNINSLAADKIKDVHKTVSNPENIKKAQNILSNSSAKMNNLSNMVFSTYRTTKYSMIAAGVGLFLFGFGFAMRPVADIYSSSKNTKNKIE